MDLEIYLHCCCLYYKESSLTAGWVKSIQKNKLVIVPIKGKEAVLPVSRLPFWWKAKKINQQPEALAALESQLERASQAAAEIDVSLMHELLEPHQQLSFDQMANDFLSDPADENERIALYLALDRDTVHFKKKQQEYTARSAEEIDQLLKTRQREQAIQQWNEKMHQFVQELQAQQWHEEDDSKANREAFLQQLISVLVYGKDSGFWKSMNDIMQLSPIIEDNEPLLSKYLATAGQPISWGRLQLMRCGIKQEFTEEQHQAAQKLIHGSYDHKSRRDFTSLPTFTIDGEKTKDYDDALSVVEYSMNAVVVAVHITDLSFAIDETNPLFEESEKRVASAYTPLAIYPMLPFELSNEYFSLKAGAPRAALSYLFRLTASGACVFQEVVPSLIVVDQNLSYEQADELISGQKEFWGLLAECTDQLQENRLENGAIKYDRKDLSFDLSDPAHIQIVLSDRNTAANRMVEELAVIVNQQTGRWFAGHQIPGLFRTQAPYELMQPLEDGEYITMEKVNMEPVRLATEGGAHAGLACDFYIQATSPMRRFGDLITQIQMNTWIQRQECAFDKERLMFWAEQIDVKQRQINRTCRDLENHWKLKFLQQQCGQIFQAKILRHSNNNRTELMIEDVQFRFWNTGLSSREVGSVLNMKIDSVDMQRHLLHAQPV